MFHCCICWHSFWVQGTWKLFKIIFFGSFQLFFFFSDEIKTKKGRNFVYLANLQSWLTPKSSSWNPNFVQSCLSLCLQSRVSKGLLRSPPKPLSKGTCSTGLETGLKPILFHLKIRKIWPKEKVWKWQKIILTSFWVHTAAKSWSKYTTFAANKIEM